MSSKYGRRDEACPVGTGGRGGGGGRCFARRAHVPDRPAHEPGRPAPAPPPPRQEIEVDDRCFDCGARPSRFKDLDPRAVSPIKGRNRRV